MNPRLLGIGALTLVLATTWFFIPPSEESSEPVPFMEVLHDSTELELEDEEETEWSPQPEGKEEPAKAPPSEMTVAENSLSADPGNPERLASYLSVAKLNQPLDTTVDFLRALNEKSPGHASLQYELAKHFVRERRPEDALALLENTPEDFRFYPQAQSLRGRAYRQLGDRKSARQAFDSAVHAYEKKIRSAEEAKQKVPKSQLKNLARNQLYVASLIARKEPERARKLALEAGKVLGYDHPKVEEMLRKLGE